MTEPWVWSKMRAEYIEVYGEVPDGDSETAILKVFEVAPRTVSTALERVAEQVARGGPGQPRSPWRVVRKRLEGAGQPLREVVIQRRQAFEPIEQLSAEERDAVRTMIRTWLDAREPGPNAAPAVEIPF